MSVNSPPLGSRPTLVSLFQSGDVIALPLQRNGIGPVEYHLATITALEDDEPNRRIRMTFHVPSFDRTGTQDVKPGNLMHRMTATDESREPVYVAAPDLWKWEGLWISDPSGDGKLQIIRAEHAPSPDDGHEVLALLLSDGQKQRAILMELTGGLFCDWD